MSFSEIIQTASSWAIPVIILIIVVAAAIKKIRVYELFVEGAKEGFGVGVRIIPYLVAILAAIAVFRGSGAMDWMITNMLAPTLGAIGVPPEIMPMAIMRSLSGSGSYGILGEGLKEYGPDTLLGNMLSTMAGSSETTFYVLAVYFGSVSIRKTRHAVAAGLIGDAAAVIGTIIICNLIFG